MTRTRIAFHDSLLRGFTAGQTFKRWPGRTIIDFDNTWFTLMTMNTNPIHFDRPA